MKKMINKQMAALVSAMTFVALAQIADEDFHYTLTEFCDSFDLTLFHDDEAKLHEMLKKLQVHIEHANIKYGYLEECKCYTAKMSWEWQKD